MNLGKHLTIILREMCDRVGADFNKIEFDKPEWFWQYSWSYQDQCAFSEWMVDYLYNSTEARNEIMEYPRGKAKYKIRKVVNWFVFNYGWKNNETI